MWYLDSWLISRLMVLFLLCWYSSVMFCENGVLARLGMVMRKCLVREEGRELCIGVL